MQQEFTMQEAIKLAIETEKNVGDFYRKAAGITKDERAKKVFETLAKEEAEHARHFFHLYTGGDLGSYDEFMARPAKMDSAMLKELEKTLSDDIHERRAMEIALREEEDLEKKLRMTASKIVDPGVAAVFERMANETRGHFEILESEYAYYMGMVHETDMDTYVRE